MTVPGGHPTDETLRAYAAGHARAEELWAIEPHLTACPACLSRAGTHTDPDVWDPGRAWQALDVAMDEPRQGLPERLLRRAGVPEHASRLVAATPALRLAWLAAAALTLLFAALAARLGDPAGDPVLFLALAPMLPLLGVAFSFGPRWEPAYEMALVAPVSGLRVLLVRTAVVLGTCVALTVPVTLALPRPGLHALGWLVPACALTALALTLTARVAPALAAGGVAAAWCAVLLTVSSGTVFSAAGQTCMLGLLLVACLALVPLRGGFDVLHRRNGDLL
ncbi:zf-HC2 domain-containing protein [Streptomyces iconiensis]|uniref:Zf-HC2 domain-containing protein n=1 Tax=Streptomyces iconiensis TaxID=1384038 RepID=A0ABT7A0I0_9ACTN|nr:zf-HC2 domain-containing protein [Streptomyces iconiensis]MDJ1134837.1 zf-HC2 domain-containing protein [Streptomyces iconiensis]